MKHVYLVITSIHDRHEPGPPIIDVYARRKDARKRLQDVKKIYRERNKVDEEDDDLCWSVLADTPDCYRLQEDYGGDDWIEIDVKKEVVLCQH